MPELAAETLVASGDRQLGQRDALPASLVVLADRCAERFSSLRQLLESASGPNESQPSDVEHAAAAETEDW